MQTNPNGRITSPTAKDWLASFWRKIVAAIVLSCLVTSCGIGGPVAQEAGNAAKTFKSQRFISLAENTSEFQKIFGRQPKAREVTEIEENLSKAQSQGVTVVKPAAADAATEFLNAYRNSTADVVTIVGHNQGGQLFFGDGTAVPLQNLANDPSRPYLVVISCQSSQYAMGGQAVGIPIDVGYPIARRTEALFLEAVQQLDEPARRDLATLQQELDNALNTAITQSNVRPTVYAIAGVGSAGIGLSIIVQ